MAAHPKFPHPFSKISAAFRTMLKSAPVKVGGIALESFKKNFRDQGVDGNKWAPRKIEEKPRRALLIKTGRLRRGMRNAPLSHAARVINDVPYAQVHNEGGKIRGTARVSSFTRKDGTKVKGHSRQMNTTIPARPFMTDSRSLNSKIDNYFDSELTKIFNAR